MDDDRPLTWQQLDTIGKTIAVRQALLHVESAGAIATWLSALLECDVTRNAVIGCCDRAGIKLYGTNRKLHKAPRKRRPKPTVPGIVRTFPTEPAPPPYHPPGGVLFAASGPHQCRYPLWDDGTPAEQRTVCGATGYPWCADHRAIVYRPASTISEQRKKAQDHRRVVRDDRLMKQGIWSS